MYETFILRVRQLPTETFHLLKISKSIYVFIYVEK